MTAGGCLLTVTFYGSERVVEHYNLMGPGEGGAGKRGALHGGRTWPERASARMRSRQARVRTRAASGIDRFDELLAAAAAIAPDHNLVDVDDVGALAAFLVSDGARRITGTIIPVDGGQHLV